MPRRDEESLLLDVSTNSTPQRFGIHRSALSTPQKGLATSSFSRVASPPPAAAASTAMAQAYTDIMRKFFNFQNEYCSIIHRFRSCKESRIKAAWFITKIRLIMKNGLPSGKFRLVITKDWRVSFFSIIVKPRQELDKIRCQYLNSRRSWSQLTLGLIRHVYDWEECPYMHVHVYRCRVGWISLQCSPRLIDHWFSDRYTEMSACACM